MDAYRRAEEEGDASAQCMLGLYYDYGCGVEPNPVRAVEWYRKAGLYFAPGICTPSDVERAVEMGCKLVKFFPAEASGGVKMLKALIGPYGHLGLNFCPTGGVTVANLADYLALPQVAFAGGTWIASKDAIKNGAWDEIAKNAADAVAIVKKLRG